MALIHLHSRPALHWKLPVHVCPPHCAPAAPGTGAGTAAIFSDECSDEMTIMADGLPVIMPGKMEASMTKMLSVP